MRAIIRTFNRILYKFGIKKPPDLGLKRDDILSAIPLRNATVKWKQSDAGEVSIVIPQKDKLWVKIVTKIFMVPEKRVVVLDEIGSYVWMQCDGEHTIKDIMNSLSSKYSLTRKEAEVSLISYMRTLGKRGMLGFAIKDPDQKLVEKKEKLSF
jgi:hypothetical protein